MRHGTLCRLFNEIALLDQVPQSNRLDHVLTTKQLPWPWKGSVATLEDAEKKKTLGSRLLRLLRRRGVGIDSTICSLASWNYRHGDEAERGLAGP
jgi:hypothetical protein